MEKIILIPEPTISDMRDKEWTVNEQAMLDYYDNLFEGMSANQVIEILDDESVAYKFISDSEIQFSAEKSFLPVIASYGCLVRISFSDGKFEKTIDVSMCGLAA